MYTVTDEKVARWAPVLRNAVVRREPKTAARKVTTLGIVGVGRRIWPAPRGEFYIRSKLTNFDDPFYGPLAFGTSARSEKLTDWPGGGSMGIHGTNQPQILPGRVSHGCISLPKANIVKLARA